MKTYKIGRDGNCQIVLSDERASRSHAVLRMNWYGKMEIVDTSQNGTFVNGTRIPKGKPFPLKRGNAVNFAHAETLDWKLIPNPVHKIYWITGACTGAIAIIAALCLFLSTSNQTRGSIDNEGGGSAASSGMPAEKKEKPSSSKEGTVTTFFPENQLKSKGKKSQQNAENKAQPKTPPVDTPNNGKKQNEKEKNQESHKDEGNDIIM